ncbi:hypothetical protein SANTM175S_09201 [Streptomyces antimycoticus]
MLTSHRVRDRLTGQFAAEEPLLRALLPRSRTRMF